MTISVFGVTLFSNRPYGGSTFYFSVTTGRYRIGLSNVFTYRMRKLGYDFERM